MNEENKQQFVSLPHSNESLTLVTPKDLLIYLCIKRYQNGKTKLSTVSLSKISEDSGASINTIRKCINTLETADYIKVIKDKKCQSYSFKTKNNFEPFSYDFLDTPNLTFTEKSYLVASQQYMYKDVENYGKLSYTNKELSEKINMSESVISRTNKNLIQKNYLTVFKNESIDKETGGKTETKLFKLGELGQAIIWAFNNHEDRITENTDEIQKLKEQVANQQKLIDKLVKEREVKPLEIIVD